MHASHGLNELLVKGRIDKNDIHLTMGISIPKKNGLHWNRAQVIVFHKEGFQLPVPSECREMVENTNIILCFQKQIQHDKS